jgi:hypothetical protein
MDNVNVGLPLHMYTSAEGLTASCLAMQGETGQEDCYVQNKVLQTTNERQRRNGDAYNFVLLKSLCWPFATAIAQGVVGHSLQSIHKFSFLLCRSMITRTYWC